MRLILGICQDMNTIIDCMSLLKKCDNIQFLFAGYGNKFDVVKRAIEEREILNEDFFEFFTRKRLP